MVKGRMERVLEEKKRKEGNGGRNSGMIEDD